MSLLSVQNLSLRLGDTPILTDVDLTVMPGQTTALIGESGSGKSITALAIMGLLPVAAQVDGQAVFDGRNLLTLSEPQLCALRGNDIAMVFQEPMTALNPLVRIGDQVAEGIRLHDGAPRRQATARARALLNRVGLEGISARRFPHELSGGQRQRVVIAMALAMRPKLLIADEPTTALDVTTQAQILDLLKTLVAEDQIGLLLITHDLAVVHGIAEQIYILEKGRVVEHGPVDKVFRTQAHPYTRALFEASDHRVTLPPPATDRPQPLLRVQGVSRRYALPTPLFGTPRWLPAVDNVSFDLHRGERVGLVGGSGCGKSTLTRAILGLEPVQAGQITIDGHPIWTANHLNTALRRQVQVVFQDPFGSFNPRHRVRRLITEPFHLLDTPPGDNAIPQALEAVGLRASDADKYIHQFSGGQRQRIAIARALIIRPRLIILDEAVSALDVRVRAQVLDLLADLSGRFGLAYLFISHDLSVVRHVTDRVLVMQAGQIVEDGPTARVFDTPRHPYTQELIAAIPRLPDLNERYAHDPRPPQSDH